MPLRFRFRPPGTSFSRATSDHRWLLAGRSVSCPHRGLALLLEVQRELRSCVRWPPHYGTLPPQPKTQIFWSWRGFSAVSTARVYVRSLVYLYIVVHWDTWLADALGVARYRQQISLSSPCLGACVFDNDHHKGSGTPLATSEKQWLLPG
jgi:hypothetical protein